MQQHEHYSSHIFLQTQPESSDHQMLPFLPSFSVIVSAVYILHQVNMDIALCKLHEALNTSLIVRMLLTLRLGTFNSANLKHAVPNFHQHITFPNRGKRILDHCYTSFKDGYKAGKFGNWTMLPSSSCLETKAEIRSSGLEGCCVLERLISGCFAGRSR